MLASRSRYARRLNTQGRSIPFSFPSTTDLVARAFSSSPLLEEDASLDVKDQMTLPLSFYASTQYGRTSLRPSQFETKDRTLMNVNIARRALHSIATSNLAPFTSQHHLVSPIIFTTRSYATLGDAFFQQTMYRAIHRAHFSTDTKKTTPTTKLTIPQQVQEAVTSASKAVLQFVLKIPGNTWFYITHPKEFRQALQGFWEMVKHEAQHYWMGSKLLYADVQTASKMLTRILQGSALSRRERKQLLRTVSDLFRLVPFSMFILIPFMEFALPFALRIFPNMLPSTFQPALKAEENMKAELQSRIAMAQFFQETLQDLAKEQKRKAERRKLAINENDSQALVTQQVKEESAASMLEFMEKARNGEMMPPDVIIRFATLFQDDLTLDNMPRMQLINMCKYMSIPPYGADSILRFQLRHKIRTLKEDDQRILWEGIDSLTKMELREACQERGMRSTGLSKDAYIKALQQWLDLSVNKNVPISLLVMSRTFFLREEMFARVPSDDDESKSLSGLVDAISGLDKDVINEVVLEIATSEERKSDPSVRRIKLEVLESQNERILEEQKERADAAKKEAAKKKEEETEKEKASELVDETVVAAAMVEATSSMDAASPSKVPETPVQVASSSGTEQVAEIKEDEDHETALSTEEMDALSQLVNPDPVTKERKELERIKAAMKLEDTTELERLDGEDMLAPGRRAADEIESSPEPMTPEAADKLVTQLISQMDSAAEKESLKSTVIEEVASKMDALEADSGDSSLDLSIARLKSRVESMVDKIEVQLTDVQVKIGNKLHMLDKDMDGILTREEMSRALQFMLKRDLSVEEAMDIAAEMDENKDGFFTVAEFIKWIDTNKLVKLGEEGRDADMDRMMEKVDDKSEKKDEEEEKVKSS